MKAPLPLFTKVLFVAFLNLCLLGLALALIMRAQFRLDPGSFLLSPAQGQIMAMAHSAALELDTAEPGEWDRTLARYGQNYGVELALFDEFGDRVAGIEMQLPRQVADRIPRRQRPRDGPPRPGRGGDQDRRPPQDSSKGRPAEAMPPLFLTATSGPTRYWAGVRVPVRRERDRDPHPGVLIITSQSLLASPLFFDVTPWLTIGAAVLLISIACWFPFIRGMTHSISEMTNAAARIAEGQFDVHVSDRRRDEIGQLGKAVNRMAERLAAFVNGQKRFLSGIAHELCNPIATIQFGLGNLERNVSPDHRRPVADVREEIEHMAGLVNELLSFSRAGLHVPEVKLVKVNLAEAVARVLEREASPAAEFDVRVDPTLNGIAEPEYLFRALSNVVRNAVRYAGSAGPIEISGKEERDAVTLTVADRGPGVPEENLEDIFAPFYRLDASRNTETGGLGLGLAVVRNCIEACHGAVRCRNRRPSGLEVEITLPKAEL